jgi:hypothetical protein
MHHPRQYAQERPPSYYLATRLRAMPIIASLARSRAHAQPVVGLLADGENSLDGHTRELVRRLDVRVVTAPGRRPYRAKGRFLHQRRDLETETNAELFVLQPVELKTGDERDAVAAWSERTRRQARVLRDEQAALRRQQAALRRHRSQTDRSTRAIAEPRQAP